MESFFSGRVKECASDSHEAFKFMKAKKYSFCSRHLVITILFTSPILNPSISPMLMMLKMPQEKSKAKKEDWLYVETIVAFGCIYICVDYFSFPYMTDRRGAFTKKVISLVSFLIMNRES